MPLTLAGVPLLVPDPSSAADRHLLAVVQRSIDVGELRPFPRRAYPGPRLGKLAVPTGFDPAPPVRVNRLYWPWGASRFGCGWWLASRDQTEQVAEAAFGDDGTEQNIVTLEMTTPGLQSDETFQAQVYCLTPVPLARRNEGDGSFASGLYLLPVVCPRFYWWDQPVPEFSSAIDGVNVQWKDLLQQVATALEITLDIDDIDPAYRLPDPSLGGYTDEPLPLFLDGLCFNVGHRFVMAFDGTARTVSAQTALSVREQDDASAPQRTLHAGGTWFRDNL